MKFNYKQYLLLLAAIISIASCGKKKPKTSDNTNGTPVVCNLSMASVVVNDTVYTVASDTAYTTLNNTFYTEHKIDNGHGGSAEFEGGTYPLAGTYSITPIFTDVIPGSNKVYIQYFTNGISYNGQSGSVVVTGTGASAVIEFCKIKFMDSFGNEKTVSIKSDSE